VYRMWRNPPILSDLKLRQFFWMNFISRALTAQVFRSFYSSTGPLFSIADPAAQVQPADRSPAATIRKVMTKKQEKSRLCSSLSLIGRLHNIPIYQVRLYSPYSYQGF